MDANDNDNEMKIGKIYTINMNKKIGQGSFGDIFIGGNLKTKEEVAVKVESLKSKAPQLLYESKVLKILQGGGNS
jgi:predicted Ser/Thr protein kinase